MLHVDGTNQNTAKTLAMFSLYCYSCTANSRPRTYTIELSLWDECHCMLGLQQKGEVLPYLLPSVGPGADPYVQAVNPQVTWSHLPVGRLPLLSARPAVTFPAEKRHRPLAGTKLCCLVTEAYACEQLVQGCYLEAERERSTVKLHRPQYSVSIAGPDYPIRKIGTCQI